MKLFYALMVVSLLSGLSACGNKGKLKSPAQVEAEEAKKAQKQKSTPVPAQAEE